MPTRVIEVKKGQLTGRIIDAQSGKPIPGAVVSIQGEQSVKTDSDGNHTIMNLTPGLYKVSVIKSDFSSYEKSIMIGTGSATRGDFAMKKESGNKGRGETSSIIIHGKNGQLRGQVTDAKSGKPIAGVTISVSSQRSVITDQLGNYAIMNLTPGSYQIIVRKMGFADAARAVTVGAGQTATANFTLNSATRNSTLFRLKLPKRQ